MNEKYSTPGKWLQAAREAQSLQPADIAKQMHLSVQSIIDLEQDEYAKIGVRTFARGYLSTYARIVGVSQAQVLEMFDAIATIPETLASGASVIEGAPVMNVTRERSSMRYSPKVLIGTGSFFIVLFALIFHSGSKTPDVKKDDPTKPVAMMSESIAIPTVMTSQPTVTAASTPEQAKAEIQKTAPTVTAENNNVGSNTPFVKKPKAHAHVTYKVSPVASEEQKAS